MRSHRGRSQPVCGEAVERAVDMLGDQLVEGLLGIIVLHKFRG